jgi:hypothetical protein
LFEVFEEAGVVGGHRREPGGADLFAGPPLAVGVAALGEAIAVEDGADVQRGFVGEGVGGEEAGGEPVVVEEFGDEG